MTDVKYRLHCEYCGYSKWTDGTDISDLVPYKRSSIQAALPTYDPATKKTVIKPFINLPKQFKCPGCGRLIRAKKYESEKKDEQNNNPGT